MKAFYWIIILQFLYEPLNLHTVSHALSPDHIRLIKAAQNELCSMFLAM